MKLMFFLRFPNIIYLSFAKNTLGYFNIGNVTMKTENTIVTQKLTKMNYIFVPYWSLFLIG